MDRRTFIHGLGTAIAASTVTTSISSCSGEKQQKEPRYAGNKLKLSFQPYELELRHAFNLAKSSRTKTPGVQVRIEYDGITGYGEASMPPYLGESTESVCRFLNEVDLAQFTDPFRLEDILDYVDHVAPDNRAAKASIDIALHDLIGKIIRQPWYKIWGLSPEKAPNISFTIGIDSEEVVRAKVRAAEPYKILKVKMGLDRDKETIETIRSMTDRPIFVDVNQGWNKKEHALEMIHWLAERKCLLVEQPLPKEMVDEMAWLKERSPLPLIADEFLQRLPDVVRAKDLYDGINIKLMKCTGMHEAYQMVSAARALGLKLMIGCMTETSCAISAAAQLSPLMDWADLDGNLLITNDCFEGAKIVDGQIRIPDRPGIGVIPL